jgi:hypothetical protein
MKITVEQLLQAEARSYACSEATIQGDFLRELIRLALVGIQKDGASNED